MGRTFKSPQGDYATGRLNCCFRSDRDRGYVLHRTLVEDFYLAYGHALRLMSSEWKGAGVTMEVIGFFLKVSQEELDVPGSLNQIGYAAALILNSISLLVVKEYPFASGAKQQAISSFTTFQEKPLVPIKTESPKKECLSLKEFGPSGCSVKSPDSEVTESSL